MKRWLASAVVVMAVAGVVRGGDPVVPKEWPVGEAEKLLAFPDTPEMRAETARLVKELSSGDFAVREKASKELAAKGVEAFPGLREAVVAAKDAELTARTGDYFKEGKFQVGPNVPAVVVASIKRYEEDRARLLDIRWRSPNFPESSPLIFVGALDGEDGALLLKILLSQETDARFHRLVEEADAQRVQLKARLAIAAGKMDDAERMLLDEFGRENAVEDWVVLRALREGAALDVEKERAKLKGVGKDGDLVAALLYRAKGDFGRSADFAKKLNPDGWRLAEPMLVETGRWAELAKFIEGKSRLDDIENTLLMGYWAQGDADQVIATLGKVITDKHSDWAPVYALHDRAEDAIAWSIKSNDRFSTAFHLLCAQLRVREALASIRDCKLALPELVKPLYDLGLDRPARELLEDMTPSDKFGSDYPPRGYFHIAGAWELLGDLKKAQQWRDQGLDMLAPVETEYRQLSGDLRVLEAQIKGMVRNDPGLPELERRRSQLRGKIPSDDPDEGISLGVFPLRDRQSQQLTLYWRELICRKASGDLRVRFERAVRIVRGDISPEEIDALVKETVEGAILSLGQSAGQSLRVPVAQFHRQGHDDWALKLTTAAVSTLHDPGYWALMGDVEMDNGHWRDAVEYYRRAAVLNVTDGSLAFRMGLALSKIPETKAAGVQLQSLAPFLVLSNYDKAQALADVMRTYEGENVADQWYEAYTRRYSGMEMYHIAKGFLIVRDAAEKRGDVVQAFEMQKKLLFSPPYPLDEIYNGPTIQMLNWAHYYRLQALEALSRKDVGAVVAGLEGELRNGPPDVGLMEKVWPLVKGEAGARKVLGEAVGRLRAVVEDWPEAGRYGEELKRLEGLR